MTTTSNVRGMGFHSPKSVEEIVKEAQNFDHKSEYPLRIALRTAQNILNQAANYERNGNTQDAYLFLYRHAEFCMTKVSSHPDRKQPEFKQALSRVNKEVRADLEKLEELKPEINKRYQRYQESLKRIEAGREKEKKQYGMLADSKDEQRRASLEEGDDYSRLLNAGDHSDLALRLARSEQKRRDGPLSKDQTDIDDLTQHIRALGRQLDSRSASSAAPPSSRGESYAYPQVPQHAQRPTAQSDSASFRQQIAPMVPGKETYGSVAPPELPSKPRSSHSPPPLPSKAAASKPSLPPKEDLSSSNYTFTPSAFSEDGTPLRPVFLPTELRSRFLFLAQPNTSRNLETCGILCGTIISNALFISHLVIPGQISTSDTCDTTEEGDNALFDYVDGEQLMVCGWIHTHPSQTCFLSSRDLHTSVGYQVMMPESIAIVCAPSRDPDHGIFRLTDPSGKQAILACHKQGLFHPHEQDNLYTDASRPGHVSELAGLHFQVVDLRGKG